MAARTATAAAKQRPISWEEILVFDHKTGWRAFPHRERSDVQRLLESDRLRAFCHDQNGQDGGRATHVSRYGHEGI